MNKIVYSHVTILFENKTKDVVTAVDDISFSLSTNKIISIVGYSGSGKSSILKCLTDAVIYEGNIYFDDTDIQSIPVQKRDISYMDQNIILYPNLNVYDNIIFPLKIKKIDHEIADQKVKEIAHELGIDFLLTRKTKYISIGQAARVALARALVKDSSIYLFDEINANLDPIKAKEITSLIKEQLKKRNKTVLYVTHDVKEATSISDLIMLLHEGHLKGIFTPDEFIKSDDEIAKSLLKG